MPFVGVTVRSVDNTVFLFAQADSVGHYVLPYTPVGTYTLSFRDFGTGIEESAHQKVGSQEPDQFAVTLGATTTVDEQFLATGAISGRLTRGGAPVAGYQVAIESADGPNSGFAITDADGRYRLEALPGPYVVSFRGANNGLTQWAHQKIQFATADRFTVAPGADTIVDDELLATGTVAGHLLDADGNPAAAVGVEVFNDQNQLVDTTTDAHGDWQATVFPGAYTVDFFTDFGRQYAHGKASAATGDRYSVAANETTRADDQLAPTGSIAVTMRDTVSGLPVTSFCLSVDNVSGNPCTTDGTLTVAVLPGSYGIFGTADTDRYQTSQASGVTVSSGHTTSVVLDAVPSAAITVAVRDARTGAALAHVCVAVVPVDGPSQLGQGGPCTDGSGNVRVSGLDAGSYNVFAFANDQVHGDQWVGAHGGVGAQKKAAVITVAAGQTVAAPKVKLDRRGTLTGAVRDRATGAPIANALVGFTSNDPNSGSASIHVRTDAAGRYTFDALGPYDWPIFYAADGYASEWSGNTGNRLQANPVTVKAGKTRNHDEFLNRGVTLTGLITGFNGEPVSAFEARVLVFNADSFDLIGFADTDADGRYSVPVLPRQNDKLFTFGFAGSASFGFWYTHANNIADATVVRVNRKSPLRIDIPLAPPHS